MTPLEHWYTAERLLAECEHLALSWPTQSEALNSTAWAHIEMARVGAKLGYEIGLKDPTIPLLPTGITVRDDPPDRDL
jgi:hypothetical protein